MGGKRVELYFFELGNKCTAWDGFEANFAISSFTLSG